MIKLQERVQIGECWCCGCQNLPVRQVNGSTIRLCEVCEESSLGDMYIQNQNRPEGLNSQWGQLYHILRSVARMINISRGYGKAEWKS